MLGFDPRPGDPREASPLKDLGRFSDHTLRNRRNLLVASAIAIGVSLLEITAERIKFFGIELTKADTPALRWILISVVLYNSVSYFWHALNEIREWRWSQAFSRIREMTQGWAPSMEDARKTIQERTGEEYVKRLLEHEQKFIREVLSYRACGLGIFGSLSLRILVLELALPFALAAAAVWTLGRPLFQSSFL